MPATTSAQRPRTAGRPLKSPLAVTGGCAPADAGEGTGAPPVISGAVVTGRGITLAEFEEYLRTVNNRDGRPYQKMAPRRWRPGPTSPGSARSPQGGWR